MTGGVMPWHDRTLYLIARQVGPTAAQAMARLPMRQWHGRRRRRTSPFHHAWITGMRSSSSCRNGCRGTIWSQIPSKRWCPDLVWPGASLDTVSEKQQVTRRLPMCRIGGSLR